MELEEPGSSRLMNWFENGAGIVGRVIICDTGILTATEVMAGVCETSDAPVGANIVTAVSLLSWSKFANVVIGCKEFERLMVDGVPVELMAVVCETSCAEVETAIVIVGSMLSDSELANVVTAFEGLARKLVEGVPDVTKEHVVL